MEMTQTKKGVIKAGLGAHDAPDPGFPARRWLLLLPVLSFLAVLSIATLAVLRMSFGVQGHEWSGFSLHSYAGLLEPYYTRSLWLTLSLAFQSTVLAMLLAVPVAMAMARTRSALARRLLLTGVLLPLLVNLLLQSYGWLIILAPGGVLNNALLALGVVQRPVLWLYRENGVLLGLVQTALPLAVLPMASALKSVSTTYEEAAATMGASRWQILRHVLLPLAMPGILASALLVFAYNASAFAIPLLLGGRRVTMLAVLIRDQIAPLLNWPAASAASVILMLVTLGVMAVSQKLVLRTRKIEGGVQ
ncbi:putative spermidine/putrescine transport system permease protein [Paralcaligenes ureilyticus]|uniref:Putative spermidine/putrescine transport system permease protein n=2 Tax=Paralcaligenes ureilyticus TaxID=627131 RepID=A0A4R3MBR6_9BURK|nr:putative spermidine/putrescine transport system permease protein [Paralcaligenes ureilyticus]